MRQTTMQERKAQVLRSKRVYITGCAGAGTTLVQRLMTAFEGVEMLWGETSLESFARYEPGRTVVAKRHGQTLFSNGIDAERERRHVRLISEHGVRVINCTRGGERFGYGDRWKRSMEQAERYAHLIAVTVRYEELIRYADMVQQDVAEVLDLEPLAYWSEYPAFVPDEAFTYIDDPRYRARPLGAPV